MNFANKVNIMETRKAQNEQQVVVVSSEEWGKLLDRLDKQQRQLDLILERTDIRRMDKGDFMKKGEVCKYLGISLGQYVKLVERGELVTYQVGAVERKCKRSEVEEYKHRLNNDR